MDMGVLFSFRGYYARNLGIDNASAQWVAFLDADDEWYPEHLEKFKNLTEQFANAEVLGSGWVTIDPEENDQERGMSPYYAKRENLGAHFLTFEQYLDAEVKGLRPFCTSTACIKRSVLLEVGGFPAGRMKRSGDVDTWLRTIEKAGGMAWSNHIGAIYYRDAVNMCTRNELALPDAQRETVRTLLRKYEGETARLLKQFVNRRTISAWRQNVDLPHAKNFTLVGKLYLGTDTKKNVMWIILSLLPRRILLQLIRVQAVVRNFSSVLKNPLRKK